MQDDSTLFIIEEDGLADSIRSQTDVDVQQDVQQNEENSSLLGADKLLEAVSTPSNLHACAHARIRPNRVEFSILTRKLTQHVMKLNSILTN